MMRSKLEYPFTTRTSAQVIRHAVSIDERRSRFRNELIADTHPRTQQKRTNLYQRIRKRYGCGKHETESQDPARCGNEGYPQIGGTHGVLYRYVPATRQHSDHMESGNNIRRSLRDEGQDSPQNIEEVWFPGTHMDIGGGMKLVKDEEWLLSHVPLVWMVQEAQRAGLRFDTERLKQANCFDPSTVHTDYGREHCAAGEPGGTEHADGQADDRQSQFEYALKCATIHGQIHDSLRYNHGISWPNVMIWRLGEYVPFRRMEMRPAGSWEPVRYPLPRGKTRSVPANAIVHASTIRRMETVSNYRPTNLIEPANGKAATDLRPGSKIGEWEVHSHQGSIVRETYCHKKTPQQGISGDRKSVV